MRVVIFALILFMIGCASDLPKSTIDSGQERSENLHVQNDQYRAMAVHCLRDFLVGEDSGGSWTIVEKPLGSILIQDDIDDSDNPCIDFANYGCGLYRLQYKVIDLCCKDSTIVRINKRCCNVTASLSCN